MVDKILGSRFVTRGGPAWHKKGSTHFVGSAREGLGHIGNVQYSKRPLTVEIGGSSTDSGFHSIVRHPVPEDKEYRILGKPVGDNFRIYAPEIAAATVDEAIGKPIETMAFLDKGKYMFISVALPSYDVRGNAVQSYLLLNNPFIPGKAITTSVTDVMVVCWNTLQAALKSARETHSIQHTADTPRLVHTWLHGIYDRALATQGLIKESYNIMAFKDVSAIEMKWIINETYPLPKEPKLYDRWARLDTNTRIERWEKACERQNRVRRLAYGLYDGDGRGMDTPAMHGTAFGALNAVTEIETFRRGSEDATVRGLLAGERGNNIRLAYSLTQHVVAGGTVDESAESLGLRRPARV